MPPRPTANCISFPNQSPSNRLKSSEPWEQRHATFCLLVSVWIFNLFAPFGCTSSTMLGSGEFEGLVNARFGVKRSDSVKKRDIRSVIVFTHVPTGTNWFKDVIRHEGFRWDEQEGERNYKLWSLLLRNGINPPARQPNPNPQHQEDRCSILWSFCQSLKMSNLIEHLEPRHYLMKVRRVWCSGNNHQAVMWGL